MIDQITLGIAIIIATFGGPIAAVLVTRWIDGIGLKRERRMQVFRDLMRTRRLRLSPDHVGALNLVEIEFHGEAETIGAWKEYLGSLNKIVPENITNEELDTLFREQDRLLTKLLHAMSCSLKFKIEQLDIFDGGYTPKGWNDIENQQQAMRLLLIDLLKGNRAIPIASMMHPTPSSPYPPPPDTSARPHSPGGSSGRSA
ncbi:MAG: hypothetical protein CMM50_11390 [Rhodospirillaceae bacterium]|nr:hypothetical protein [Rhodospirillaceae bacterium]|tara:strand:+ start:823 stop:1422 length:600 start_codon:yes stop_codon:yes gene_type:complete